MRVTQTILHTAQLTNNCPTCFANNGLEFTFSQEETETKYYTKATNYINETLYCHNCKHAIYPVNWTDNIDRVYQYNKKLVKRKNSALQFKRVSYIILLLSLAALTTLVVLLLNY